MAPLFKFHRKSKQFDLLRSRKQKAARRRFCLRGLVDEVGTAIRQQNGGIFIADLIGTSKKV
jgi:hypothetical protein